jgi:hypothetical protein
LHSGLTIIPFAVGSGMASGLSIRLIPRFGKRILVIGAALAAIGVAITIYSIHIIGTDLHSWQLIPAMFIGGVGLGLLIAPSLNFVLAGIGGKDVGSASGVLTTVQQIGGALGVAAIGVIFFGQLAAHADAVSAAQLPQIRQQLLAGNVPPDVADHIVANYRACFHDQSAAKDPTVSPQSCVKARQYRPVLPPPAGVAQMTPAQRSAAIAAEYQHLGEVARGTVLPSITKGVATNFSDSIQVSLFYNVAVFAITFLLLFFLPSPKHLDGPPPAIEID